MNPVAEPFALHRRRARFRQSVLVAASLAALASAWMLVRNVSEGRSAFGRAHESPLSDGPSLGDAGFPDFEAREPELRIVVCGGQRGRVAPCGCTSPQSGGLLRLAALLERERGRPFPVRVIQFGSALGAQDGRLGRRKSELFRDVFETLRPDAVLLGADDLPWWSEPATDDAPGWDDLAPLRPLNLRTVRDASATCEVGERPRSIVRIAHLVGTPDAARLRASGLASDLLVPEAAIATLPADGAPWIVGLESEDDDEAGRVLGRAAGRTACVLVRLRAGPSAGVGASRLMAGRPVEVCLAPGGHDVLLIDLLRASPRAPGLFVRVAVVPLDAGLDAVASPSIDAAGRATSAGSLERVPAAPTLAERVGVRLREESEAVARLDLIADLPRLAPRDDVPAYVGGEACAACHGREHRDVLATRHAQAFATLRAAGHAADPECVVCHTTGFERTRSGDFVTADGGFRSTERTPDLLGVGCEACHGPGAWHVAGRAPIPVPTPGAGRCTQCHDPENSPAFARRFLEDYLPRVDHRGARPRDPPRRNPPASPPRDGAVRGSEPSRED